ncbi:uncharacterized protein V6R79_016182 [Siganus canaliculatus]
MASAHFLVPNIPLLLLSLWPLMSARGLKMVDTHAPELTCSEGLTDCHVSKVSPYSAALPDVDDSHSVTHVQLEVILCCPDMKDCEPCLQITIEVQEVEKQGLEESGDHNDEEEFHYLQVTEGSVQFVLPEPKASVKVCLSLPVSTEVCKALQFKPSSSVLDQATQKSTHELLLTERVTFDTPVVVQVDTHSDGADIVENITVPSLVEVCSMTQQWTVKECDAPRLIAVTNFEKDLVLLQLVNTSDRRDDIMYQMVWNEVHGEALAWPTGKREMVIPSSHVAPCLCFQVWWKGMNELRQELCPFRHQQDLLERMQQNVSMSVAESQLRDGGSGLSWNVTAPCRLNAEVWLCMKDLAGGGCEEVNGSRQRLHGHIHAGWRATRYGHWKTGEFNVSSHPQLCMQMWIHGMESYLEPQCPFAVSRLRWSLALFLGLLFVCLVILGVYFIQGVLKGYMWKWIKEDDVKGAVGGGYVLLLYSPDDDQALPELMNHLGSSLQTLGFSVSLDLWSQAELGVLGPVPWLHSRLNRLQKQRGKVVLVLTQTACMRAEEWGAQRWERSSDVGEEKAGRSGATSSRYVDVFTASLSCILADYLQGRAGERFMLVQFESLPPEPPGSSKPLPELFRGLHVYSLPSQSLGFLTELAGARQMPTASARRKRAGGLRVASRALAQRLSGFRAGTTMLRLADVSQSCVGAGYEDSGERVPLQEGLVTPSSSPDMSPKVNEMDWV